MATHIAQSLEKYKIVSEISLFDNAVSKVGRPFEGFSKNVEASKKPGDPTKLYIFVVCSIAWFEDIKKSILAFELPKISIVNGGVKIEALEDSSTSN